MAPYGNTPEEQAMLDALLSGLSDSVFDLTSSPLRPSQKQNVLKTPRKAASPRKQATPLEGKLNNINIDELLDGAENWDWDDMDLDFEDTKPKIAPQPAQPPIPKKPKTLSTKCRVIKLEPCGEVGSKTLIVKSIGNEAVIRVILRNEWQYLEIEEGDTVNLIGHLDNLPTPSNPSRDIPAFQMEMSSAAANLIIHHPDLLISSTNISQTSHCARRPVINSLLSSCSVDLGPNAKRSSANIWGTLVHEIMQKSLEENRWSRADITGAIDSLLSSPRGMCDLFKSDINPEEARKEILERAQGLESFGQRFIAVTPRENAKLTTRLPNEEAKLAITTLLDIEEDIIAPAFGIKGKIDASVEALMEHKSLGKKPEVSRANMPFEIKTGRATQVMEHRAQTILYTLLMEERYGVVVPAGLLYYTQADEVIQVAASFKDIRSLIIRRNEMADFMMRRSRNGKGKEKAFLPEHLQDKWACTRCYAVDGCMLYRKAVEGIEDTESDVAELYASKTDHLTPSQIEFFRTWEQLITLEEQDGVRFRKELWTMTANERQEHGRCFADMVLLVDPTTQALSKDGRYQFTYTFKRRTQDGPSLISGHLGVSEFVTISVEPNLLLVARGTIISLHPDRITVALDKSLNIPTLLTRSGTEELVFRIDKDEVGIGMTRIRDNLAQLFYAGGDSKRLSLVVDLRVPEFAPPEDVSNLSTKLNPNQLQAVEKVLSAKDYALILGMPGTGKTTTIAEIIKILVQRGNSVLFASYTHSAVDTILLKLKDQELDVLRVGNADKVHPEVREYTLDGRPPFANYGSFEHFLLHVPVVATTCLSIEHAVFSRRRFDYCIIDEASQITLPSCLGPLRFADKFVLVGDHFQLPPLIRSKTAREGGFDVSLFRKLSEAHPSAVVELAYQYRMNEDIMLLSNKLIYSDRLQCGSKEVAERSLRLPNLRAVENLHAVSSCPKVDCWMEKVLSESCKAVFVDTDALPAQETQTGTLTQNDVEASLVQQTAEMLTRCGLAEQDIGVVSLYRQQLKLIQQHLRDKPGIELLTADKSQGRDKECIMISMVRSNADGFTGELLKDWRRINVAFTRARSKLIVFGSRKTLSQVAVLDQFLNLMDKKGWILKLPSNAHLFHPLVTRDIRGNDKPKLKTQQTCLPTLKRSAAESPAKPKRPISRTGDARSSSPVKPREPKRAKLDLGSQGSTQKGVLKSRPILGDIMNNSIGRR